MRRGHLWREDASELYNAPLGRGVSLDNHLGWTRREVIRHPNRQPVICRDCNLDLVSTHLILPSCNLPLLWLTNSPPDRYSWQLVFSGNTRLLPAEARAEAAEVLRLNPQFSPG